MVSVSQLHSLVKQQKKPGKYGNKLTTVGSMQFQSKLEAIRWGELRLLEYCKKIRNLEYHKVYQLEVNGQAVCKYEADFTYEDIATGATVVEDTKSPATRTPVYMLKKRLMLACLGIKITEVYRAKGRGGTGAAAKRRRSAGPLRAGNGRT